MSLIRPDYILQNYSKGRLNEEAVSVERVHFYKTDKSVNPKQEDAFRYFKGELPILLSAPHAVRHYRQKRIKMSDEYTGSIVYLLNKLTRCHALATIKLYGGDPNVDNPCLYKEKVRDLCKREKIRLVLDIHGASSDHKFDIDLGTHGLKTLRCKFNQEILERNFQTFGLNTISIDHFAASGPYTVTNFVARELEIPAVQIEINKMYRSPAQNPQGFHRLLGALVISIQEIIKVN